MFILYKASDDVIHAASNFDSWPTPPAGLSVVEVAGDADTYEWPCGAPNRSLYRGGEIVGNASLAASAKKAEVSALLDEKANAQFTHGGRVFDADSTAQNRIHAAVSYGREAAILDATARTWTLADNTDAALTWGELRAMATALFERSDACHIAARTHKNAIDALATEVEIAAYDINTGWPA